MSQMAVRNQIAVSDRRGGETVIAAIDRGVRNAMAATADFVEPCLVQCELELLDPKVRNRFTGKEKGEIDAHFHGC